MPPTITFDGKQGKCALSTDTLELYQKNMFYMYEFYSDGRVLFKGHAHKHYARRWMQGQVPDGPRRELHPKRLPEYKVIC